MAASPQITLESLPEEVQDEIIRSVPVKDLPNVMLSTQTLYRLAKPHFYHSLYYFGGVILRQSYTPSYHNFALSPRKVRAYDPTNSARVVRLAEFLRTMTENPGLPSHIDEISFSVGSIVQRGDVEETDAEKERLNILRLITLNLAFTSTITSMDVMYPGKDTLDRDERDPLLRDQVYSLFKIPGLRHLCLRKARTWRDFSRATSDNDLKAGTSNVVSLSLLDTVPMDTDLQEILTWPKGLKHFHHENTTDDRRLFFKYYCRGGERTSPERFLNGIASQKNTLEELSCNNVEDRFGGDDTQFTSAIISQFTKLTHLFVDPECLIYRDGGPEPLYTTLPPNLLELHLYEGYFSHRGDSYIPEYVLRMRGWLQEVADHRENGLPALKAFIYFFCENASRVNEYRAATHTVLEQFKDGDIHVEFAFRS